MEGSERVVAWAGDAEKLSCHGSWASIMTLPKSTGGGRPG